MRNCYFCFLSKLPLLSDCEAQCLQTPVSAQHQSGKEGLLSHHLAQGKLQEPLEGPQPRQFRFRQVLDNFRKEEKSQALRATKI